MARTRIREVKDRASKRVVSQSEAPKQYRWFWPLVILAVSVLVFLNLQSAYFAADTYDGVKLKFDPYTVLGVDRTASSAEIKRNYRELIRKRHPDHVEECNESCKQLYLQTRDAYKAIGDDVSRNYFERTGRMLQAEVSNFSKQLEDWVWFGSASLFNHKIQPVLDGVALRSSDKTANCFVVSVLNSRSPKTVEISRFLMSAVRPIIDRVQLVIIESNDKQTLKHIPTVFSFLWRRL